MKSSYKFSLVIAVIACILIIVYYATRGNENKKATLANANNGQSINEQSLGSSSPQLSAYDNNKNLSKDDSSHKSFAQRLSEQLGNTKNKDQNNNLEKEQNSSSDSFFDTDNTSNVPDNENDSQNNYPKDSSKSTQNLNHIDDFENSAKDTDSKPSNNSSNSDNQNSSKSSSNFDSPRQHSKEHIVKKGETLAAIAKEAYGSSKYWVDIAKANPDIDPDVLQLGQKLKIPDVDSSSGSSSSNSSSSSDNDNDKNSNQQDNNNQTTYTIQSGDTLSTIAKKLYGDKHKWARIYRANRAKIGPDPSYLQEGQKLDIPR